MTVTRCPECGGIRFGGDPSGLRYVHHPKCTIQAAEDATLHADRERGNVTRPITDAERALLVEAGVESIPDDTQTHVEWLTTSFRRRSWPTLDWKG